MFEKIFARLVSFIKTNRSNYVVTKVSANGSPVELATPVGKTPLYLAGQNWAIKVFSSEQPARSQDSQTIPSAQVPKEEFFNGAYKALYSPTGTVSLVRAKLTDARSQEIADERREGANYGKQIDIVRRAGAKRAEANPTYYAHQAFPFPEDLVFQNLHIIGKQFVGKEGQCRENLVIGTEHANRDMADFERTKVKLLKIFPKGLLEEAGAKRYHPKTHVADKIYCVVTDHDDNEILKAQFDGLKRDAQPKDESYASYKKNFDLALEQAIQQVLYQSNPDNHVSTPTQPTYSDSQNSNLLFRKSARRNLMTVFNSTDDEKSNQIRVNRVD